MAEDSGNCLPYGQFGQLDYDIDDRTWNFTRIVRSGRDLLPLGETSIVATASSVDEANQLDNKHEFPGRRRAKQVQDLATAFPSVLPAAGLLSSAHAFSEEVEVATSQYDPVKGDLLAFGTVASEAHHRPIRVVAFPGGRNGNEVRVVEMKIQRQGWHDTTAAWLEFPIIRGDEGVWNSDGAPIQQICFAEGGEERGLFMAVRMIAHTTIFRPVLRKSPVNVSSLSRFDLNPVADVSLRKFGGMPHADVAFNPFFPLQFAIVDQAGCWSIFEFEGRQSQTLKRGVSRHRSFSKNIDKPLDDGWARILWCGSPTSLIVAGRRCLLLFDTSVSPLDERQRIEFDGWVLAVALIPSHLDYLCVLTTSHLEIYRIVSGKADDGSLHRVLQWRHFRSPEDITLGITITRDDDDLTIFVRSSVDTVATAYGIKIEEDQAKLVTDPFELKLPSVQTKTMTLHHNFKLESIKYGTNQATGISAGRIAKYHRTSARFYCMTSLQQDLTIHQTLFFAPNENMDVDFMEPPTWQSKVGVSSTYRLKQEGFIADDDDHEDDHSLASEQMKKSHQWQRRTNITQRSHWTIGFEHIASELVDEASNSETQMTQALVSVETTIHAKENDGKVLLRTVFDSCPGDITVQDIDEASAQLQKLVLATSSLMTKDDDRSDDLRLKLNCIVLPRSLRLEGFADGMDLSRLYDQMIGDWVSTLSPQIPGRTRTVKAKALLQAAAEITMATRVFQLELPQEVMEEMESQPTNQVDIRLRRPPSPTRSTPSVYLDASSQLHSQTSSRADFHSAAPSQITSSTRASALLAPRITRMSRYTTFSQAAVPLSRSMETVIAHWDTSANPEEYDWLTTTRQLARRRDVEDEEELNERDRAKVQRRAERHIRRQRREAAASQAAMLASSQAPEIAVASQPASVYGGEAGRSLAEIPATQSFGGPWMESSQTTAPATGTASMFPASQIVPGRFGGRPPPKKKAKRKQGF
ncbi:Hypothetical protein R9X50_00194100 [Acrodontium crateriforme]|uniref:RNA polymerase I-specific transcription initiation factor RRN6-like protein n=1 Tax=Acrodontium crateriforme TaxID=150365 RepID=A0AAQ3R879_9PEZI|nr:Hypothetical protein R9X50_00194100 [Acrodontium crateriforme]